jgi:hypothetical protein
LAWAWPVWLPRAAARLRKTAKAPALPVFAMKMARFGAPFFYGASHAQTVGRRQSAVFAIRPFAASDLMGCRLECHCGAGELRPMQGICGSCAKTIVTLDATCLANKKPALRRKKRVYALA